MKRIIHHWKTFTTRSAATIGLFVLACPGCDPTGFHKPVQGVVVSNCCQTEFSISLFPETPIDPNSWIITISEGADAVQITEGRSLRTVPKDSKYKALKRLILDSQQWREKAVEPYHSIAWTGPPRDILTVTHKEAGLNLQGDRVPEGWKRRILEFIR